MGHLSHYEHVSQSYFPFSQDLVLRCWWCVLVFSCLLLGYFLCRRVTSVTCRDICWLFFCFQNFLIWLENTLYCLCIMMRLFTIDGCGDYRQGIFNRGWDLQQGLDGWWLGLGEHSARPHRHPRAHQGTGTTWRTWTQSCPLWLI